MDFYLATPTSDVYLFSYESGRIVDAPPAQRMAAAAEQGSSCDHVPATMSYCSGSSDQVIDKARSSTTPSVIESAGG